MQNSRSIRRLVGALALAAGSAAVPVLAQQSGGGRDLAPSAGAPAIQRLDTSIDASGDYRGELQACRTGHTAQDEATCLKEARNAQAARRDGQLTLAGEDYMANALMRCQPLSGEEKASCEARVLGFGQSSGSVAGGGLLRSVETVVLPRGQEQVTFAPKTQEPVVVVPMPRR